MKCAQGNVIFLDKVALHTGALKRAGGATGAGDLLRLGCEPENTVSGATCGHLWFRFSVCRPVVIFGAASRP